MSVLDELIEQEQVEAMHRTRQRVFGGIHTCAGLTCLFLDLTTVSLTTGYPRYGAGIFCGVFLITTGLLGLVASRVNGKGLLVGSMVTNFLTIVPLIAGFCLSAAEIGTYDRYFDEPFGAFIHAKAAIVLALLLLEFFLLLAQILFISRF